MSIISEDNIIQIKLKMVVWIAGVIIIVFSTLFGWQEIQIDNLKNDVDFLEEKHRKLILELESNKKDEIADKMKQEKIKDQRQNEIADSLMKFFSIEIIPAKELAEKFLIQKEMNKDLNIFQFMMGKGYKEIPVVLPIKTE